MKLARELCKATEEMPRREAYGMAEQMRRAAVSIPSNIAEGYGRLSDPQFRHFLGNARGSLFELQTQTELAIDLGYLDRKKGSELLEQGAEVGRVLNGLLRSFRSSSANPANNANPAEG